MSEKNRDRFDQIHRCLAVHSKLHGLQKDAGKKERKSSEFVGQHTEYNVTEDVQVSDVTL